MVDREWVQIKDFTPGIRQLSRVSSFLASPQELGSADPANTYRCMALPRGGLAPLPKRQTIYTRSALESVAGVVGGNFAIVGFHVSAPLVSGSPELHIGYEWEVNTNTKKKFKWDRIGDIYGTPTATEIYNTGTGLATGTNNGKREAAWFADGVRAVSFATITTPGYPNVSMAWMYRTATQANGFWRNWSPGIIVGTLDETEPGGYPVAPMIQHQNRFIGAQHVFTERVTGDYMDWNEFIRYTEVNWPTLPADTSIASFSVGPQVGYGVMASVGTSELLCIRHRGGGLVVVGDVADPTIISLPGVVSTHGAVTIPAHSPLGLVYASRDGGVFVWGGGNSSEKISVDLEDNFWDMTPTGWGFSGKFDTWQDWILCPNNWVFDTVTKSWWRMDNPADAQIFQWGVSTVDSQAFGTPTTFADSDDPVIYTWDKTNLATSYRWRSNILMPTVDRWVDVRDIEVRAVGTGTVTITVSNEAGDSQAETITLSSATLPKLYRKNTKITGSGIRVQIDSDSGSSAAAPVVFEVGLGIQPNARAAA